MAEVKDKIDSPGKFAVVEAGGGQMLVREGEELTLNRLAGEVGAQVTLGRVLMVRDGENLRIGQPEVTGVTVTAKILAHVRGRKVLVGKFKKNKNYRRKRGHRQELTRLRIETIAG